MSYPAGIELDVRTAGAANWSTSGFTADAAYPDVTADDLWIRWLRYLLKGELPPGTRVFCGVTLPAFSTDLNLARAAATAAGYTYLSTDNAVAVSNGVVAYAGPPWAD